MSTDVDVPIVKENAINSVNEYLRTLVNTVLLVQVVDHMDKETARAHIIEQDLINRLWGLVESCQSECQDMDKGDVLKFIQYLIRAHDYLESFVVVAKDINYTYSLARYAEKYDDLVQWDVAA